MAELLYLRCGACGSNRRPDAFGIDAAGDFQGAPEHEPVVLIQTLAGRGKIAWRAEPMPLPVAQALRACLAGALDRLDAEIAEATGLGDSDDASP